MINRKKNKNYFELLWVLAKTDFKLRYHGSILGYLWSLLKPLLMFGVLYIVFSVFMRWNLENYQLYLLLGIIIWNFFAEATMAGLHSLICKADIIKKVYFPRILIVLASTISAFFTLLLNFCVFLLIFVLSGLDLHVYILFFPLYLLLFYIFVVGISLALSVLQIYFRDMLQIWEVLLQAGFFISPIIYPMSMIPSEYWFYMFLNPVTGVIQYSRMLLINETFPSLVGTLYIFIFVVLIFFMGLFIFNKFHYKVAEKI